MKNGKIPTPGCLQEFADVIDKLIVYRKDVVGFSDLVFQNFNRINEGFVG